MKKSMHLLLIIILLWSCKSEDLEVEKITPNVQFGLNLPNSDNARLYYDIDHATITLNEGEFTSSTTYTSLNTVDNSIDFYIPKCLDYELVALNVYDSQNKLILVQSEEAIGSTVTFCKPYLPNPDDSNSGSGGSSNNGGSIDVTEPVRSVWFDWETATYVSNNVQNPVLPWIGGASTGVARGISLDHKREDGWVLMHHTFELESGASDPKKYLLFYNRFTGNLRMWYWHEGSNGASELTYSIQALANTSLLNFNGDFALPMDQRQPIYSEFVSGSTTIPSGQGLAQNTWYLFEYEMAYDDQVASILNSQSDFIFGARGVDIDKIELSGVQTGQINGQVVLSAPGANLFNFKELDIDSKTIVNSNINSANTKSNDPNDWWTKAKGKISDNIVNSIGNASGSLASSILNLASTPVTNFLNSLVHQGLENTGSVNLSMATTIKMHGTLTNQAPVSSFNLIIPGSQENSIEYLYDKPVGVFNLNTLPTIIYEQTYYHIGTSNPRYFQYYNIDETSFAFVINPEIANEITILETSTELYYYEQYSGSTKLPRTFTVFGDAHPNDGALAFETKDRLFRYYKIREGTVPPPATTSYGLMYDNVPSWDYFRVHPVMEPESRLVVRAILKYKINATGREVTIVKSYIPQNFVYHQTIDNEY